MAAESKLELSSIRAALIRQEDTIIFALIERAQFKANAACYEAGRAPYTQLSGSAERSFLDHMLLETERVHGRVRRYTAPVSSSMSRSIRHTPVVASPARIARSTGAAPRQRGRSEK